MRLTRYTDYAIRVLIYLGTRDGESTSIRAIADTFAISQNHLMKVVQDLAAAGFVQSIRGRNGGILLARPAADINIGAVLRHTEGLSDILDCSVCMIAPACGLPPILSEATKAFVAVFDKYTVADLIRRKSDLHALLRLSEIRNSIITDILD
ncbi:Rrf2 family transcriptional regulator [Rhizobium sp. Root73]|uniref:Rrf2 family transcriptional regulator n=1 Tax=unclassified Rhizobium TaxID=2613769 RepID=UPI000712B1FB|nr:MULTISPECIES: Rrf2 family transcriptional regulator [unclassified Rhizobium]KQY14323.1 Rrf2 family transcriptional regulator [Rhizobium sp. Root1334]KQY26376.1 Rrf2 family transcriptional regulator [Rhizobium sp. Root483D2]KRC06209.1 Rrf2 family transcriptional regulator [Rhizobium sp. Root73]